MSQCLTTTQTQTLLRLCDEAERTINCDNPRFLFAVARRAQGRTLVLDDGLTGIVMAHGTGHKQPTTVVLSCKDVRAWQERKAC